MAPVTSTFKGNPGVMGREIVKVEGREGSDKEFEAKLWRLEGVIRLGQKLKIRN